MERSRYYVFIIFGVFLIIVSPQLFSDGMFMDGVYYATISRNWAEGMGTFWRPYFTEYLGNPFYDHPPLVFLLQGIYFKILGDHYVVERLYSMTTYIVMVYLILKTFNSIAEEKFHKYTWFAVLLWLIIPKSIWSISNNLLENTLMLFTTSSILFSIKFIKNSNKYFLILSGLCLFAGFLSKGFVALFPLSFLFFYFIFKKSFTLRHYVFSAILQFTGLVMPLFLIAIFNFDGITSIKNYLNIQVLHSLNNVATVDHRAQIIIDFINELLPSLVICLIVVIIFKLNKHKLKSSFGQNAILLTLAGTILSGVLPIMISLKQRTFYLIPTFSLTAILLAVLISPFLYQLVKKEIFSLRTLNVTLITVSTLAIILNIYFSQEVRRDKDRLADIRFIVSEIGENKIIYISTEISQEMGLHAYFQRYGHLSLYGEYPEKHLYMIKAKGNTNNIPEGFNLKFDNLKTLDFYSK